MNYRNTVEFAVNGNLAMFADPITRVGGEKCSYHVPTYESLKGILHSIYWKPTLIWIIDEVRIINPIQTQSQGIRTKNYNSGNDLSIYTYLKNVKYEVKAHFEWNMNRSELEIDRNENKHHNIAKRMIDRGGRRDIFLGTRECQGYAESCKFGEESGFYDDIEELAFGHMFHGFTYPDEAVNDDDKGGMTVRFWYPVMKKGIITFTRPEECTNKRFIKEMEIKPFGEDNFTGLKEFESEVNTD